MDSQSLKTQFSTVLSDLEAQRAAIVRQNTDRMFLAALLMTVLAVCSSLFFKPTEFPHLLAILLVSFFISVFFYQFGANKGLDEMTETYKSKVIRAMVTHFFGESSIYAPWQGHGEGDFIQTRLFSHQPDRYQSEDWINGYVDKTQIAFSEVHAERKEVRRTTNSNGGTTTHVTWHTIFKGILFVADFNKHFHGTTIVKEKIFWSFFEFSNIKFENTQFNETFSVNTSDSVEAHYILSPSMMERLMALNQRWGGSLGFSFMNSKLTVAIPRDHNFFEISLYQPVADLERDWQIIADLISIVHELDLNTRIWTKT